jgi:hypothetical protein
MPLSRFQDAFSVTMIGVTFTMTSGNGTLLCRVTQGALHDRAVRDGTQSSGLGGLFEAYRTEIEDVASRKFDAGDVRPAMKNSPRIMIVAADLAPAADEPSAS